MTTSPEDHTQTTKTSSRSVMPIVVGGSVLGAALLVGSLAGLFWNLDVFLGGLEQWRKSWYVLAGVLLAAVAGLGLLFATLNTIRSRERADPTLRRLIYGYNVFLTGLLLLGILAVINFLVYVPTRPFTWINQAYDWTESTLYAIHPETKTFLEKLDRPVEIAVLLPGNNQRIREQGYVLEELRSLLNQIKAASPRVTVNQYSPDHAQDTIKKLAADYGLKERTGVLLIYGTPPDAQTELIRYEDLYRVEDRDPRDPTDPGHLVFRGESVLLRQLRFLSQGKVKPTIYFTQGHGELDLQGSGHVGDEDGLGYLKDMWLTKADYEVKELKLTGPGDQVPDDATVVVVARPTRRFEPHVVATLNEYMGVGTEPTMGPDGKPKPPRKGKMIVLFDVVLTQQKTMAITLEEFVHPFGVEVQNNRLIDLGTSSPTEIEVATPREDRGLPFYDVRSLSLTPPGQGRQANLVPRELLVALAGSLISEENLAAIPEDVVKKLLRPDQRAEREKLLLRTDPVVGAVVVESVKSADSASRPDEVKDQPRLIVVGDASWVSNADLSNPAFNRDKARLFLQCLALLRDRAESGIELDPKERKFYHLLKREEITSLLDPEKDPIEGQAKWRAKRETVFTRIVTLPIIVLTLTILGLGLGVWILRRR